jgi:hypothetical protein
MKHATTAAIAAVMVHVQRMGLATMVAIADVMVPAKAIGEVQNDCFEPPLF